MAEKPGGEVCDVSRFAEVIVIARDAEQIMEPLTRPDANREWHQCFKPVYGRYFGAPSLSDSTACFMWIIEFWRMNWQGLLSHLESLSWPDPASVQGKKPGSFPMPNLGLRPDEIGALVAFINDEGAATDRDPSRKRP